jgi:hypothetical protein
MSQDRDALDPAARALLDEIEPPDCPLPDALREQMRSRMELALVASAGPGTPPQAPPAPPTSPPTPPPVPARGAVPWRFLAPAASALVGVAVGTMVTRALSTPQVVYVERLVPMSAVDAGPPAASALPAAKPPAPPLQPPPSAPSLPSAVATVHPPSTSSAEADDPLVAETRLIDTARAALARRDFAASLAAADSHAKRFPSGRLTEEREALAVQALAGARRDDEARARGARFHQRFPASLLGDTVDAALSTIP